MKKEFGKWLIDVAKLVAAGSLIIACAGFSNTSVVCLVVLCLLSIVMFVIGCSLQKDNRPKRFDNHQKRNNNREKKKNSEGNKPDQQRNKKRATYTEHVPNEITVD